MGNTNIILLRSLIQYSPNQQTKLSLLRNNTSILAHNHANFKILDVGLHLYRLGSTEKTARKENEHISIRKEDIRKTKQLTRKDLNHYNCF